MPPEIRFYCHKCGEPFAVRVGQTTAFICSRCESRRIENRAQIAMQQAQNRPAQETYFGLFQSLIPFCSLLGLALIGAGAYLALNAASDIRSGVCWIALGVLNLFVAQAGDVLLAIERRTRLNNNPERRRRSRHHSRDRRRSAAEDSHLPHSDR